MPLIPFKPGDSVLEVGGGDRPTFHPNMDVRPGPKTDIVADLNCEWPLPGAQFDGVYGSYIIEHISWRKVRTFIAECFRVLKPGGYAVMVTANFLEQCRVMVNTAPWSDSLVCMAFGDQDYPENSHKVGFSPEYASRLFREAGFNEVNVYTHPNCVTDMVIVATKSTAKIVRL